MCHATIWFRQAVEIAVLWLIGKVLATRALSWSTRAIGGVVVGSGRENMENMLRQHWPDVHAERSTMHSSYKVCFDMWERGQKGMPELFVVSRCRRMQLYPTNSCQRLSFVRIDLHSWQLLKKSMFWDGILSWRINLEIMAFGFEILWNGSDANSFQSGWILFLLTHNGWNKVTWSYLTCIHFRKNASFDCKLQHLVLSHSFLRRRVVSFSTQRSQLNLQINIDWQVVPPNKGVHVPNQILIQTTVWPIFVVDWTGYKFVQRLPPSIHYLRSSKNGPRFLQTFQLWGKLLLTMGHRKTSNSLASLTYSQDHWA